MAPLLPRGRSQGQRDQTQGCQPGRGPVPARAISHPCAKQQSPGPEGEEALAEAVSASCNTETHVFLGCHWGSMCCRNSLAGIVSADLGILYKVTKTLPQCLRRLWSGLWCWRGQAMSRSPGEGRSSLPVSLCLASDLFPGPGLEERVYPKAAFLPHRFVSVFLAALHR